MIEKLMFSVQPLNYYKSIFTLYFSKLFKNRDALDNLDESENKTLEYLDKQFYLFQHRWKVACLYICTSLSCVPCRVWCEVCRSGPALQIWPALHCTATVSPG